MAPEYIAITVTISVLGGVIVCALLVVCITKIVSNGRLKKELTGVYGNTVSNSGSGSGDHSFTRSLFLSFSSLPNSSVFPLVIAYIILSLFPLPLFFLPSPSPFTLPPPPSPPPPPLPTLPFLCYQDLPITTDQMFSE